MEYDRSPHDEVPVAGAAIPATTSIDVPRLRIAHMLLWALCAALYLATVRAWRASADLPDGYDSVSDIAGALTGLVNGATLTGTIILLQARFNSGLTLPRAPGHWLMAVHTIISLVWLFYWIIIPLGEGSTNFVLGGIQSCLFSVSGILYLFALRDYTELRWKLFFAALLTLALMKAGANVVLLTETSHFGLFESLHLLYSLGDLALCPWVLVLTALEKKNHIQRDWLHWLGVVTFLFIQCTYLIWTIGVAFI